MDEVKGEVEDMVIKFITQCLTKEERKEIWNGEDCLQSLTNDAVVDIQERLWDLVKSELNWRFIVDKVRKYVKDEASSSESEDEEEEEENIDSE
jgi:hypothetical protein